MVSDQPEQSCALSLMKKVQHPAITITSLVKIRLQSAQGLADLPQVKRASRRLLKSHGKGSLQDFQRGRIRSARHRALFVRLNVRGRLSGKRDGFFFGNGFARLNQEPALGPA